MQLFNFDNEFKLGIDQIDMEHAGLVNMLNEVHSLIRSNEKEKARAYFRDTLSAFIGQHFAHEEAFLQEIGYPQLDEHKKNPRPFPAIDGGSPSATRFRG